ncbi:winged helix-turn-helix domain-containing protein [Oceanicella actignis]|uniref:Molybdate transport system regulatory protein n=1 Tax=Oceanicella actignis TaxID=1189325 RepID=A0A1M7SIA9_9RHOB|nr:LysR family transcriptional regulator [Oceanicella actignis]SET18000.1 molybdate transport system regulatory protein [Oceanicella actignis]SHN58170.1 molybdate transport system regulatory protein [Oceanicella actignis]
MTAKQPSSAPMPALRIRVVFAQGAMIGPGKAELLERVDQTGSIAAAGRAMGMSYKRAWQLIETLNRMFERPLVTRARGGRGGGGAQLTETGRAALEAYRAVEAAARQGAAAPLARLAALAPAPPAGAEEEQG